MEFDVIVIGGGVNGCGIARDAAMRGLKTVLIEKNDFGSGTTGASSQMIHGGARYLLTDVGTTKLSSQDSGYILKIAPHLLFRIPFILPILKNKGGSSWKKKLYLEAMEAFISLYDRYSGMKGGKIHTRLNREEVLALEPDLIRDILGAVTFDEWGIDTLRLCILNVLSAREYGAEIHNHTAVIKVLKAEGRVVGVRVKDHLTGKSWELRGKILVNATGPWAPRFAELAGCKVPLRPAKGIHIGLDRRISNYALLTSAIDGRSIFLMPYQNISFIGTTDDDYFGDPDDIPILEDEVAYLREGIERIFPRIREARITHAWAGVRPTLYSRGGYEDDLSRDYKIFDHEVEDQVPGFLTLVGGKLASYRLMSEDTVDVVCKKLRHTARCQTHQVPLPGAERQVAPEELAQQFNVPLFAVNRLVYRYGCRAQEVLELTREKNSNRNIHCQCDPVLAAELRFVIRHEWARTLGDLKRRTRFALGPCQGTRCLMAGAQVLSEELGLSVGEAHGLIREFMQQQWAEKLPVLEGTGLQQEELFATTYFNIGNLNGP